MNENFIIVIDRLTRTKFIYRFAKADDGFKLDLPPLRILQCVYIFIGQRLYLPQHPLHFKWQ